MQDIARSHSRPAFAGHADSDLPPPEAAPTLTSQFLPDDAADLRPEFEIRGRMAVTRLLRDLQARHGLVTVYAGESTDEFFITSLVDIGTDRVLVDFTTDAARREALLRAGRGTLVGFLEHVKLQASLPVRGAIEREGQSLLDLALPEVLWRIQRREAFRVQPLARDQAHVVIRTGDGGERSLRVADLSVVGVALIVDPGMPVPAEGERWMHARLEFTGRAPIPCDLRVQNVREGLRGVTDGVRLGCVFEHLPNEVQRALQMYVIDTERRARAGAGPA